MIEKQKILELITKWETWVHQLADAITESDDEIEQDLFVARSNQIQQCIFSLRDLLL